MVNWQITATTLLCSRTDDEVTVMVYKDGSLKCTGEKSASSSKDKSQIDCRAASCVQIRAYFDKLMSEEQYTR